MDTQFHSLNALNESSDFIQILDSVSDLVYYKDLDNKIIWVNKAVIDVFNVEPGSLIGRYCFDVFHSGNAACAHCPIKNINETGNPQQGDIAFSDDTVHNVKGLPVKNKDGKVIGILSISSNITIQRKAETAIAKAESTIEAERTLIDILMDTIPDRIYFKDLDSRFIRINKAMATRHGLSESMITAGLTDFDIYTKEHALQALNDELEIIKSGTPFVNIEEKETFADGTITWALTTKMPLFNIEGKITGTFGISHDITNRKLAEEKINQYVTELKALNATKDKFFSIIAHDLKNPFNNILGFSELLKEEVRDNDLDAIEQYANLIYTSAHQTFRLLENLLDWATTYRGQMVFIPEKLALMKLLLKSQKHCCNLLIKRK